MTARCDCHGLPLVMRNRCNRSGHRRAYGPLGLAPIETRYFPKRLWLTELRLRRLARKAATT
jgi:hypothetical protein